MKTKKILFIEGAISFGGSTVELQNIIDNLDKHRYQFMVACLYCGEHVTVLKNQITNIEILDSKHFENWRFLKVTFIRLYHFIRIYLIIKRHHIDIIHFNNFVYYPGISAAKLLCIPCVCHLRSLPTDYKARRKRVTFITKFFSQFVDHFIAVSNAVKQEYIELGFNSEKISVIGTGISINDIRRKANVKNLRSEFKISDDEFIIGTVARLSWEKGIVHLVDSMPYILRERENVKCFIVGGGPLEDELKEKISSLSLNRNIILTGKMINPYYLLSGFDVFILPSLREGRSVSIMEAMGLGIPVIATKVGGNVELVEQGVDGILIESANADSIVKAVLSLINNKDLRRKMSSNASKKAEREFSIKDKIVQIEEVYKSVCQKSA
ncbi:MAG: glycosyltransferase family 4 protein [Candidatus Omnitrophica bacterium]|nr:glycosyltransferase family 4 protein [Candidatus Omnitrophota bacterium]